MIRKLGPVLATLALAACAAGSADDPTTSTASQTSTTAAQSATATTAEVPSTTDTTAPTTTTTLAEYFSPDELAVESFPVVEGSRPHDVAPAADGGVWYTAQGLGDLGWLDPVTGETIHVPLGDGSRPHGVIVDERGTPWVTDGGLNAVVGVDPETREVTVYELPEDHPDANLNTAAFDGEGTLWFTGQAGIYGSLDPATGEMMVYDAPRGSGPYGITSTPDGSVYYASLAGSYVGAIGDDGSVDVLDPPGEGSRRVWSDSSGAVWASEWNSGTLSRYTPDSGEWDTWPLPGDNPAAYAVYVDETDIVWVSDFGANAMVRFDPETEQFDSYQLPHQPGEVRQILGRPGEVWGAESAADHLVVLRTR